MQDPVTPDQFADVPLDELRACPHCDALHRVPGHIQSRARAVCGRCGSVLIAPRRGAFSRIIALAVTALILMVAALFSPFLDLSAAGMHSNASILDAAMAFSKGVMLPLSLAVGAFIIVIPVVRLLLILYTLGPLVAGRPAAARAPLAFSIAEALKPWSMAEIFVIGVAVALVKVAGLATVTPGPAFWAFGALVFVTVLQDSFMDKEQIWSAIDGRDR